MKSMFNKNNILLAISFFLLSTIQGAGQGALMKSMILPGWGEKSMGKDSRAKIFMYTDLAIAFTHIMGKSFERWYVDEYSGYAELYANADMQGKDYSFTLNVSSYDTMSDYNQDMSNQRNFDNIYTDHQNYNWEWESTNKRYKFNKLRRNSIIAGKFAEFAIAGLIINRFISFVDVIYLKNKDLGFGVNAYLVPDEADGVSLQLSLSSK